MSVKIEASTPVPENRAGDKKEAWKFRLVEIAAEKVAEGKTGFAAFEEVMEESGIRDESLYFDDDFMFEVSREIRKIVG